MKDELLTGYHARRLAPEQNNAREAAFAEQWKLEHECIDLLAELCCVEPDPDPKARDFTGLGAMRKVRDLSDSDRKTAATVVQWLGSNVGFGFLLTALHSCGFDIVRREER